MEERSSHVAESPPCRRRIPSVAPTCAAATLRLQSAHTIAGSDRTCVQSHRVHGPITRDHSLPSPPPQVVGGNAALALLLTIGSNLLGVLTMPYMLCWVLGASPASIAIQPAPLLKTLVQTILLPLMLGAGLRAALPGEGGVLVGF